MIKRTLLCLALGGCSAFPVVNWPEGGEPATPALLPTAALAAAMPGVAEARGEALAGEAEALKARAAAIGTD